MTNAQMKTVKTMALGSKVRIGGVDVTRTLKGWSINTDPCSREPEVEEVTDLIDVLDIVTAANE